MTLKSKDPFDVLDSRLEESFHFQKMTMQKSFLFHLCNAQLSHESEILNVVVQMYLSVRVKYLRQGQWRIERGNKVHSCFY